MLGTRTRGLLPNWEKLSRFFCLFVSVFKIKNQLPGCILKSTEDRNSERLCNKLKGWGGEEDGREVQDGRDMCLSTADLC